MAALFPNEAIREEALKRLSAMMPSGRIGQPVELANAVVFLASDEASYINGTDFQVDGGFGQV